MKVEYQGKKYVVIADYSEGMLVKYQEEHFLLIPELEMLRKLEACEEVSVKVNGRSIFLNEVQVEKRSGGTPQNCRDRQQTEENYFAKIEGRSVILITNRQMVLQRICIPQFS